MFESLPVNALLVQTAICALICLSVT